MCENFKPSRMPQVWLPVYFLCLLTLSSACYIQNCPRGGKRSVPDAAIRQCIPCGPGNKGTCFGPSICCGVEIGCFIGTPETLHCLEENYLPSPCGTAGKACGTDGRCAANGICCSGESCTVDASCGEEDSDSPNLLDSSTGDLFRKLMHMAGVNRQ